MANDPVVLTAKLAKMIEATSCCNCAAQFSDSLADHEIEAINAVADGRTVIERVTEAEALKTFEHHWDHFSIGERYHDTKAGWLAAYRALGAIKGK